MMKLSFDWSNATSPERRDLIFQNRNKQYGGYVIRKNYNKHVVYALLITFTSIGLTVIIPAILSRGSKKVQPTILAMTDVIAPIDPFIFDVPQPKSYVQSHSVADNSNQLTTPLIVDNVDDNKNYDNTDVDDLPTDGTPSDGIEGTNSGLAVAPAIPIDTVTPRIMADVMPVFPGGDEKLLKYLSKIKYPASARESNISGRVFISFVVDRDGKIKDVKLLRGFFSECDEEALRVVREMPNWIPGQMNGVNVPVQFRLPVNFALK